MSLLILIVAATIPSASEKQTHILPLDRRSVACPRTTSMHAFDRNQKVTPRKLGDLPPANAYSAVYRLVGGCEVPVVVRYGIGGR